MCMLVVAFNENLSTHKKKHVQQPSHPISLVISTQHAAPAKM